MDDYEFDLNIIIPLPVIQFNILINYTHKQILLIKPVAMQIIRINNTKQRFIYYHMNSLMVYNILVTASNEKTTVMH